MSAATASGLDIAEQKQAYSETDLESAMRKNTWRLLPVLVARKAAADEAVREAFPHLQPSRFSAHDAAGWAAGAAAADVASLDIRRAVRDTAG